MTNSITKKLFFLLFSSTLLLSAVYTFFIIIIAYVTEDTLLERILDVEAKKIISVSSVENQPRVLPSYLKYYKNEQNLPQGLKQEIAKSSGKQEIFGNDGKHYHIKHIYHGNNKFGILVAEVTDLLVVTALAKELMYFLIGLLILMLILVSIMAYKLAKYIAHPIKSLANDVQHFSPDLHINNELCTRNDEIGFLAHQLQVSMSELTDALKRERYFTADISHELRTPLTYFNNKIQTIDLAEADRKELIYSMNEVSRIVTVLLTLARSETLVTESIQLSKYIEQAVLNLHDEIMQNAVNLKVEVDSCIHIEINAQLLSLILKNIIENAVVHSESDSTIYISASNNQITFTNNVPSDIKASTNNFYGFGHGTHLITKLSEAAKLSYKSENSNQQYTVVLSIPPEFISIKK